MRSLTSQPEIQAHDLLLDRAEGLQEVRQTIATHGHLGAGYPSSAGFVMVAGIPSSGIRRCESGGRRGAAAHDPRRTPDGRRIPGACSLQLPRANPTLVSYSRNPLNFLTSPNAFAVTSQAGLSRSSRLLRRSTNSVARCQCRIPTSSFSAAPHVEESSS